MPFPPRRFGQRPWALGGSGHDCRDRSCRGWKVWCGASVGLGVCRAPSRSGVSGVCGIGGGPRRGSGLTHRHSRRAVRELGLTWSLYLMSGEEARNGRRFGSASRRY